MCSFPGGCIMRRLASALLVLAATSSFSAHQHQLDDGLYVRSREETPLSITTQDGAKVFLKGPSDHKVLRCDITSQDNANSKYYVYLRTPYTEDHSDYVLIVSGTGYTSPFEGAVKDEYRAIGFIVVGDGNAELVARSFKTAVRHRAHPRHGLLVSWLPSAPQYSAGDEVTATLRIENVGTNTVAFQKGGRQRAARDNQYVFSARYNGEHVADIGSSSHLGGLSGTVILRQGEVFEDRVNLNKWFAFDRPGTYDIHGAYYLAFREPDDQSFFTIWEDYASADFQVMIRKTK